MMTWSQLTCRVAWLLLARPQIAPRTSVVTAPLAAPAITGHVSTQPLPGNLTAALFRRWQGICQTGVLT